MNSDRRSGMRHVVMISGHGPPTMDGVGDATAMLLAELARQRPDWRWTWLTRRPGWWRSPVVAGPGYRLVRPNHTWTSSGRRVARAALRWLAPDLVHVQEQVHSFFETEAAARLAEAAGCPVVTTLHEYHIELPSVVYTDELVRLSAAVIANDARNAERCLERTGRAADARWWSGSTVEPPPGTPRRPEPDVVTTFGFLTALKSVDVTLEALERLRSAGRPLRWRIIGPFEPAHNRDHAAIARLGRRDWIEFTGGFSVRDPRLLRLLGESRLMLLPFADGASLRRTTLFAAWAFGVPAITTPPPGDEPEIVDGENCLLVREPTPEAWARGIERLLDDPALEARLSAGGRCAAERYGWPVLARRHLALYDRVLAGDIGQPVGASVRGQRRDSDSSGAFRFPSP
jgi:glycosyltransferase involved in cell wall biosynthesis